MWAPTPPTLKEVMEMFRKVTLRRMPPQTREYARLLNDLESVLRRGKNMVEKLRRQELEAKALANARERGIAESKEILQRDQNEIVFGSYPKK